MGRGGRGIWLEEEKRTEVVISGFLEMLCHVSWDKVIEATFFFLVWLNPQLNPCPTGSARQRGALASRLNSPEF